MEFPHGHDTQTHNHRRNDDEEERREHYPPPPPSSDQTPPPLHYGENEFAPPSPPYSHNYQEPPQPSRPYSSEPNYSPPPPPTSIQETKVFHTSHHQGDDPSLDYPPPPTLVTHVSDEQIETHNCCRPHMPRFIQRHAHQSGFSYGVDLYNKLSFKVYSKARPEFHLTIRDGKVILARSSPSDEFENWFKDEKYSTRVKDSEGCPAFALVNKATGQAMKHSIGEALPVQLIPYNQDVLDESILWTESKDLGDGFRAVRMVNNTHLNVDAFHGDKKSGGVRDGTTIVLWKWNKGDNQQWKIIPTQYYTMLSISLYYCLKAELKSASNGGLGIIVKVASM
ncbi:hypothetical protein OIU77_004164 [Salix suchowensis]|uniref:Hydroxyproline-rich glycoprotein family protein n=1 Tax=Salix suchowensis TaxID=1278906 RepID=A0ABQ9AV75_9ROSI|nr:hypothetical protein OIU77_004164 [Salix suchowensis]